MVRIIDRKRKLSVLIEVASVTVSVVVRGVASVPTILASLPVSLSVVCSLSVHVTPSEDLWPLCLSALVKPCGPVSLDKGYMVFVHVSLTKEDTVAIFVSLVKDLWLSVALKEYSAHISTKM